MALDHTQYEALVHQYFNQLKSDQYETVYCPLCEAFEEYLHLFQKGTQKIVRCKCGLVYSKRQPRPDVLKEFYEKSDALKLWSELKETPEHKQKQKEKFSEAIKRIKEINPDTLLDIGCGNGEFLSLLGEASPGIGLLGLEPNEDARLKAETKGLTVFQQTLDSYIQKPSTKWDFISMWGVLEHVKDPTEVIRTIGKMLTSRGHILICVPNVASMVVEMTWGKCFTFCPQHLWYFDSSTLIALLQNNGFQFTTWWTIEDETIPVLKAKYGVEPYEKFDLNWDFPWLNPLTVERKKSEILNRLKGYKIVMIARKV